MSPVILFKEIHVIMSIQSLNMFWQLTESKLTFGGQNKLFLSDTISIIEVFKEKLDRVVDRVKPWFMVHGLAHSS